MTGRRLADTSPAGSMPLRVLVFSRTPGFRRDLRAGRRRVAHVLLTVDESGYHGGGMGARSHLPGGTAYAAGRAWPS